MDFTAYPNLQAKIASLGGIKQTFFNKKKFNEYDEKWQSLPSDVLARIEAEIPYAQKVMTGWVMPTAIITMRCHVLEFILVKDIVWIYTYTVKNSMNFIPTTKEFSLEIVTRDEKCTTLGPVAKSAFTRKNPGLEAQEAVANIIGNERKGIIYGWSEEIRKFVYSDIAAAAKYVDDKSNE